MSQPTVCCVMLTADRPALAKRAVECFRAQTYPRKRLLVYDTGKVWLRDSFDFLPGESDFPMHAAAREIGTLRNHANELAEDAEIICHWDDDDWSHPNRIAEQVALTASTGAAVCGYIEMLFWREPMATSNGPQVMNIIPSEVWHWTGPTILGTSLCYRRAVWERFPFPDTSYGEDTDWLKRVQHAKLRVAAQTSLVVSDEFTGTADDGIAVPRMIARIHAGNTSKAYAPKAMKDAPHHWSRVHEWDDFCRSVME